MTAPPSRRSQMTEEEDIRDAMLFRFWCRAASAGSGMVNETAVALMHCLTVDDYRKALTDLARRKGVNLP